jgi:tRNA(Leu) C34 or U34 (ribose-2'-O)-methylase TrmL
MNERLRGYAAIGLHQPKFDANIGGALRAATCYDAKLVLYTGVRFRHHVTDTCATHKHVPLLPVDSILDHIPHGAVPIAVEITDRAIDLTTFHHPERALYIFGPEDGSLGPAILNRCAYTVYVPTETCMNLAATVNVVLYDRMAKRRREQRRLP